MDNSPSSTEPTGSELPTTSAETADAPTAYAPVATASAADSVPQDQVALVLPVADHAESVSLIANLQAKLAGFEHEVVADLKADVAKLKALLHL